MKLFKRALALMLCLGCLGGGSAFAEGADDYEKMLANACLSLGNNYRLKKVLDRAQAGEQITVAIIGVKTLRHVSTVSNASKTASLSSCMSLL